MIDILAEINDVVNAIDNAENEEKNYSPWVEDPPDFITFNESEKRWVVVFSICTVFSFWFESELFLLLSRIIIFLSVKAGDCSSSKKRNL